MTLQDLKPNIKPRLDNLHEKLISENLDAILISNHANRYYLTGWQVDSESGYLLITKKENFVITDSRYVEEALTLGGSYELAEYGRDPKFWENLFKKLKLKRVGFESKDLSVFALKNFKKTVKAVQFVSTKDSVENLRKIKDENEIALLRKSISIADKSFNYILKNIKLGQTENEIAWKLEQFMRENGASKNAWNPFIVASGPNSSKVHYVAGDRKIKKGDQILIDWGCVYQGYSCDISRTVFVGTPTEKQASVYNLVLEAQKKGIEQVKVGGATKKADFAAREFLEKKTQFAFGHAIGHGVGIEVHELPHVNPKTKYNFEIGNVVTVEPGIYEPGWGGVRIEDMVLVTKTGAEVLTRVSKKLEENTIKL